MTPNDIVSQLSRYRFCFGTEEELQRGVEKLFGHAMQREARLSPTERPDFFLEADGIVLEIKIKGSFGNTLRQLNRYAKLEVVKGIVLLTTRSTQALRMPDTLQGKPLAVHCIRAL